MKDVTRIMDSMYDVAEWLVRLPEPDPSHIAAAATLLLEASAIRRGVSTLTQASAEWTAAHNGMGLPMPNGDASLSAPPADVSRETLAPAGLPPLCGMSDAGYGGCVLNAVHSGQCQDSNGYQFTGHPDAAEVHH